MLEKLKVYKDKPSWHSLSYPRDTCVNGTFCIVWKYGSRRKTDSSPPTTFLENESRFTNERLTTALIDPLLNIASRFQSTKRSSPSLMNDSISLYEATITEPVPHTWHCFKYLAVINNTVMNCLLTFIILEYMYLKGKFSEVELLLEVCNFDRQGQFSVLTKGALVSSCQSWLILSIPEWFDLVVVLDKLYHTVQLLVAHFIT